MNYISVLFGQLLKFLYDFSGHYGIAIILFTLLTKLILLPLTVMQSKSTASMKLVTPLTGKISEKYSDDQQAQAIKLQEVYRKYGINPLSGCLPLLIQLPIIFALFATMRQPEVYVFGSKAAYQAADAGFLWINSLSKPDIIEFGKIKLPFILPILTAIAQFLTSYLSTKNQTAGNAQAESMQKSMMIIFPVMMLFWGISFPSGLILYWFVNSISQSIMQQLVEKLPNKNREAIEKQVEEDLKELENADKSKKKGRVKKTKKNEDFYDEYSPVGEKEIKRVRRIPKSAIVDSKNTDEEKED